MARRSTDLLRFPRDRMTGLVLSDEDHAFLVSIVGPFHGADIEDLLATAPAVAGGRCLNTNHPAMDDLHAAIGVEAHGFMKLEDEESSRPRRKPKRGGTAERLLALYQHIDDHRS